ncbi:unnamed protein product [Mucor hiemalis]
MPNIILVFLDFFLHTKMSYLDYKASFKAKNKYLKFFRDNPMSAWDFQNFQSTFKDKKQNALKKTYNNCLITIKNDSRAIPSDVKNHIDALLDFKENEKEAPVTIVHNNYNNTGDVVNASSVTVDRRKMKKQKIYHDARSKKDDRKEDDVDEKEEEENWITILDDCESVEDLRKYSPERNGVERITPKLEQLNAKVPNDLTKKVKTLVEKIQKKKPSLSYSESVYNDLFVFRFMNILLEQFEKHEAFPFFLPGEEELIAMSKQLQSFNLKLGDRKIYKADGIVRDRNDLELMLLETTGSLGEEDPIKASLDNSKGMFALLSMLKTVADRYTFASCESFKKVKLLYLQASGCHIRLWQMKYKGNVCYEYARVAKAKISEEKEVGKACISNLEQFMAKMQECLGETLDFIELLQKEHEAKIVENESDFSSDCLTLSDVICPQIFEITY